MLIGMRCALLLLILITSFGNSLSTGTFGREFYIGILKTYIDILPKFSLLITSNTSGTATIYMPHFGVKATRSFNQSLEYKVSEDTITKVNTTIEHKGIHVTTDVDATLVVIKYMDSTWEGFLALPTTMLSTRYVISSYESYTTSYLSDFLIVSVHDNTDVEIHVDGTTYSVSMNHLDTYLFRRYKDLSGVTVNSSKPVAVFSGHEATKVPITSTYVEYMVEQLLPTTHFAQDFIVPPTPPKSGYVVRAFSSVQNTSVTFHNATDSKTITLYESGDFHEIISDSGPMYVMADKPVQVVLYGTSHDYNNDGIGCPFMSIVPSIQQFLNSYHFTVFSTEFSSYPFAHYLVIISRTDYISGLRINGHQLKNLYHTYNVSHANITFTVNIYNMTVGVYHLQHIQGKTFGAMQYGFYRYYSYGYVLGINNFKDCGNLNAPVNGHADISKGTTFGSQAIYSCTSGYTLHGGQKRTCLEEGYWNGSRPNCQLLDCGNLNAPVHGQVDISNGTTFGSQAIYNCMSGYTLQGEQKTKCLADGQWNGPQPSCQPLDCGNLNAPVNGHVDISNGTTYGSQAIYSCTSGYTLHGGQKRTCLADGYWNGSQPNCQSLSGGITCLDCKDMSHLYLCDTVTTCSDGQVCYVETYTTSGGQLKYNSGCVDSQQCSSWKRQIGRRSSECVHCCSTQLCNVNGCGGQGLPSPDLRGPLCYECSYVSNMDECKTVKLCAQDEVCSIEKYDWGGVYDHYTTKCHSKQCLSHKRSFKEYVSPARTSRSTPVCQNCCSYDLCNINCNMTSQSGTGVAIVG